MFSPPLPRDKSGAIASLAIGCINKIFIEFLPDDARHTPDHSSGSSISCAGAAQNGCHGASNGACDNGSHGAASAKDRAVVAYQLLWRSDAAALGPSAAPLGDGAGPNAPKLWDSASSHLSAGAAVEAAAPAPQGRLAAAGTADAPNGAAAPSAACPPAAEQAGAASDRNGNGTAQCSAPADSGWMPVPGGGGGASSNGDGAAGVPAWVRGIYSLRLWGPEFLAGPLRTKRNGYTAAASAQAGQEPAPATQPVEASGADDGGVERPPVGDTAAALGTLNLEQGGPIGSAKDPAAEEVPDLGGAGAPRRRGGANAEAYLDRSAGAAGAAGLAQAGCCAVMWITGADAQAMEAAPDEEARPLLRPGLCAAPCCDAAA